MPDELAAEVEFVDDLSTDGAEADLYLVRHHGQLRALKMFRQPDRREQTELQERVQGADAAHVVRVYRHGEHRGKRWELQEYVELGSLVDLVTREGRPLSPDLVLDIAAELTIALEHFHSLRAVHRDVKPSNVLVRTREPLDLVLADFGLVVSASEHQRSSSRTSAYAAPEAMVGGTTAARDWWSLGITLLELLSGLHPFQHDDGTWMEEYRILNEVISRPIPLDRVDHERWRLALRGLLTREPERRWGAEEMRTWLSGGTPDVADDPGVGAAVPTVRPFGLGGGVVVHSAEEMAEHLSLHWDTSPASLVNTRIDELADWVAQFDRPPLDKAVEAFRSSRVHVDALMARLVINLGPPAHPSFRGVPMHPVELVRAADAAARGTADRAVTNAFGALRVSKALREYAVLPGHADLVNVAERWSLWHEAMTGLLTRAKVPREARDDVADQCDAALLACALDEGWAQAAVASVQGDLNQSHPDQDWWQALRRDTAAAPEVTACAAQALHARAAVLQREVDDRRAREARDARVRERAAAAAAAAAADKRPIIVASVLAGTGVLPWLVGQFVWRPHLWSPSVTPPANPAALSMWQDYIPDAVFGLLVVGGLLGLWLARPPWTSIRRRRSGIGAVLVVLGLLAAPMADATADAYLSAGVEAYATGPITAEAIGSVCGSVLSGPGSGEVQRSYAMHGRSSDIAGGCTTLTAWNAWKQAWTLNAANNGAFVGLARYGDVLVARQDVEGAPNTLIGFNMSDGGVRWRWSCKDGDVRYLQVQLTDPGTGSAITVTCKNGTRRVDTTDGTTIGGVR